ncbi:MAG: Transcriptional regulator, AraC family [uncultured Sphingomonadaceae bacterium]|uniref:Transcriptional regulator, AraC family n=1 Tax=uncultured Sphingomonadaceae bacterium TaxID=169976 RepID=A0A6J4SGM9_9SPHN|nr:MAG: Transcriptional regulator, AraC family [uncultured Sphingomonadaceae bacterium]
MALADPPTTPVLPRMEQRWREMPRSSWQAPVERVVVGRWTGATGSEEECVAESDCHVLEVNLRSTDVRLTEAENLVHDGRVAAGSVLFTRAGCRLRAVYRSPFDLLHLFIPVRRFEALLREAEIAAGSNAVRYVGPDPIVTRLALSLLGTDDMEAGGSQLYLESIAQAIVARVIGRDSAGPARSPSQGSGLVKWRQRRVMDFVEANLADTIRLQDLARAAGLSRMHFAAQFRAATGLRPHDYVVRRRIERAQDLLRESALPLAQVALGVGFQTQAHFTTVFREHVQETPGRWRQLHRPV